MLGRPALGSCLAVWVVWCGWALTQSSFVIQFNNGSLAPDVLGILQLYNGFDPMRVIRRDMSLFRSSEERYPKGLDIQMAENRLKDTVGSELRHAVENCRSGSNNV